MESRGVNGRLIVAFLIFVVGIITYLSQTQTNPVTGEKQHISLSTDDEIKLGLQSAPEMSKEMGGEVADTDPHAKVVQNIGNTIISKTVAHKSPWKFQFHLLSDTETVNAFALPGGQVFITLGLLNLLETEAQLAGVLSHEVGHVLERHTAQQMAKSELGQSTILAVGTAASDSNNGSYSPVVVASVINQMFQLHYSRTDESQADEWGIKLMIEMGYDPRAMVQVMEILKKSSGGQSANLEIFQTHPNPDLRIKQIDAYLEKNPPPANLSEGRNLKDLY